MKILWITIIIIIIGSLIAPSIQIAKSNPYLSPLDLYKQSDMVFYGQVISKQTGPGPDSYYYQVKVETYFKNPQNSDSITIAGYNLENMRSNYPEFEVGDKAIFFIGKENGILTISPNSSKAGEGCDIHAFLGPAPLPGEPIIRGVPSPLEITNANMTARGEFATNTPVLVTYQMWNNYPQPRNFTVDISVSNQDNNSISFHKKEILQDDACDVNTALRWIFTPDKVGTYLVNVTVNGEFRWGSGFRVIEPPTLGHTNSITRLSEALFKTDHGVYPIQYNLTKGGLVSSVLDLPARALIFTFNTTEDGKLSVELPRKIIDSTRDGHDKPYFVAVGDPNVGAKRVRVDEVRTNNETRFLAINFGRGLNEVEIVGTYFVENNSTRTTTNQFGAFSPLKQWQYDIDAQDVICKKSFVLVIKSKDNFGACVKPQTEQKLVEKGWGILASSSIGVIDNQEKNGILSGYVALAGGPPTMVGPKANYEVDVYSTDGVTILAKTLTDTNAHYSIQLLAGNYIIYAPDYPAKQTHHVSVFSGNNTILNIVYGTGYK